MKQITIVGWLEKFLSVKVHCICSNVWADGMWLKQHCYCAISTTHIVLQMTIYAMSHGPPQLHFYLTWLTHGGSPSTLIFLHSINHSWNSCFLLHLSHSCIVPYFPHWCVTALPLVWSSEPGGNIYIQETRSQLNRNIFAGECGVIGGRK